jgi:integrase
MPSKPRRFLKLSAKATKLGIRVRRVTNRSGGAQFGYSWLVIVPKRVTGKERIRKQYPSTESKKALDYAEGVANLAKVSGEHGFALTVEQRVEAEAAFKRLGAIGLTMREAVDAGIRFLRPAGGDITFGKLRDNLLAEKQMENLRPDSINSLRFYVGEIVAHFGADTLVKTATKEELKQWVTSIQESGKSLRHVKNYVAVAKQFFRYAHKHEFTADDTAKLLSAPKLTAREPAILTLAEVRRLLSVAQWPAHNELLPAVVLALFAGLRTEEVSRLNWAAIDLRKRKINVSAEVAKTRDRRTVTISKNAVEFLLLSPNRAGAVVPTRFNARLTALHTDAFTDWKSRLANGKRHSFGTYFCKLHGIDQTVDQMGNSARMLINHYQAANVTRRQATDYFALTPANVGTITPPIPFPATDARTA